MKKKILLIAGNYFPEPTGIGRYNAEMMDWLANNGYECTVISTYPYYPYWQVQCPYQKKSKWFSKEIKVAANNKITVYRCPHYIPGNPTGKRRMLSDFSFFISVTLRLILLSSKKYDYIMNVSPPLLLGLIAAFYKKISGSLFLYHIQDLQVDAAQELNMISSKRLISFLFKTERFIFKKADRISTISPGMQNKVLLKTDKEVYLFPNWTDTKVFFPLHDKPALKKSFNLDPYKPVILYSGAIGEKQGLINILFIARDFQNENIVAQFVICGSGPYKAVLIEKAAELKLNNVIFMSLQSDEKLNAFLNMADIHLVIQKAGAADLVMPSKLCNIFSIRGLAIVTANEGSSLYDVVNKFNIGLLCPAENEQALKNVVAEALTANNNSIRSNARNYAEKYLSIDKIMHQYITNISAD